MVYCKWVFRSKEGIHGVEPAGYKARLVAMGFNQNEYLNGSKDVGLLFKSDKKNVDCLEGFVDSNYGGGR